MNRLRRLMPPLLASACFGSTLAQGPENAPPWWGVQDDVTVSVSWNFDQQTNFLQPSFEVVPNWYVNQQPFTPTGDPLQWVSNLNGHQGVYGLVATNPPTNQRSDLNLFIDNDPHLDWVKIFWFQFDAFESSSGSIEHAIQQQLGKYGRAAVTVTSAPLAGGWEQITVSAELIPQPDDEEIDFTFLQFGAGITAIDNLHVSSKCVKPRPDEDGDALGKVLSSTNLTIATGGRNCRAVAATRSSTTGQRRQWVAAIGATSTTPHGLFEVDAGGVPIGPAIQLPSNSIQVPLGPMDMTVERRRLPSGIVAERIYVLLRNTAGQLRIRAFDPSGLGALQPAFDTIVPAAAAPIAAGQRLGLAFDISGDDGNGTFWITGRENQQPFAPKAFEFNRQGQLIDSFDVPFSTFGFDYDDTLGNFYCFTRDPVQHPNGTTVEVVGVEISGFTHEPTGVRFLGNLLAPNAGGPPGGQASGMTLMRVGNGIQSQLRFACVADTSLGQVYSEIAGPFRYGYSRFGTIGMQNGPPFVGGAFDVTLHGVPEASIALLFLGASANNVPISPGIQAEQVLSIVPDASSPVQVPISPGRFSLTINVPNMAVLNYAETYYQWLVVDSSFNLGFSQAGKTVLYP
ncbi:MAG: hypothetical protein AB8H80_12145 [Planctomycetota bacterium]